MDWRIRYADGSCFSSEDGSYADAPAWGVLHITCANNRQWRSGDQWGLLDWLVNHTHALTLEQLADDYDWRHAVLHMAHTGVVKFGRTVDNDVYQTTLIDAQNDPDFNRLKRNVHTRGDFYWYIGE